MNVIDHGLWLDLQTKVTERKQRLHTIQQEIQRLKEEEQQLRSQNEVDVAYVNSRRLNQPDFLHG